MSRHTDKGTIKIGTTTVQEPGKGFTAVKDTGPSNKKTKKDDSDTKKGKQTFKSKFVYGGSKGVDESVDKKKYEKTGKHKLRNQFDYLTDKYYGGDREAFAKTSQGQLLLNYLTGVTQKKGGFLGSDTEVANKVFKSDKVSDEVKNNLRKAILDGDVNAIRNLARNEDLLKSLRDQPELNRTGILTSPEYARLNELIFNLRPTSYAEARPFSSGQGIGNIIERFVPAYISGPLSNLLPKAEGVNSTVYKDMPDGSIELANLDDLPRSLLNFLPTQPIDEGGVNEVAQSVINTRTPMIPDEEDEEFDITQFDPDSFISGFGFPFVDPSLFNLDGTGITGLEI